MNHLDYDGGDIGYPDGITPLVLFPALVREVAKVMSFLYKETREGKIQTPSGNFSHGFKVRTEDTLILNLIINELKKELPNGVMFYELDDKHIFDLRGQSGGIITAVVCYLVTKNL
jgi:hypothetical protein